MRKYSFQREQIRKDLNNRTDHPTADMVYESVRKEIPNISLGTVYRNLHFLADHNELKVIHAGDGKEHFDARTTNHSHFVCDECGSVIDLVMDINKDNDDIVARNEDKDFIENFKGVITSEEIIFHGVCENCIKK